MPNIPPFFTEPAILPADILEKWENIGFLEGLDDDKKNKCAHGFEIAVEHILTTDSENQALVLQMALPIIRRLIADRDNIEIYHLLDCIDDFMANHYNERVIALQNEYDPEASAVAEFCDNYKPAFLNKLRQLSL